MAGGKGDVRGQSRTLFVEGILDDLHQHSLALARQARCFLGLAMWRGWWVARHVAQVQERRARQAHIHEHRLDARHLSKHAAHVDVAHQAGLVGPLDMQLAQLPIHHQRHAGLESGRIDKKLFAGRSPADSARCRRPPLGGRAGVLGVTSHIVHHRAGFTPTPRVYAKRLEQPFRLGQGQADNGVVAAVDFPHEHAANALNAVAAGFVGRFAGAPIGRHFILVDGAKRHLRFRNSQGFAVVPAQRQRRVYPMCTTGQGIHHGEEGRAIRRFAEYLLANRHRGIRRQYRQRRIDAARLRHGQTPHIGHGRFVRVPALVQRRLNDLKRYANLPQQHGSARRRRGKHDCRRHVHRT